jgi:hypothetical protein
MYVLLGLRCYRYLCTGSYYVRLHIVKERTTCSVALAGVLPVVLTAAPPYYVLHLLQCLLYAVRCALQWVFIQ